MTRRLVGLVTFLLLGAVVNVAVAWGCAWWLDGMAPKLMPSFARGVTAPAHPRWRVLVSRGAGSTVVQSGASRKPAARGTLPADATQPEIDAWVRGEAVRVPRDVVEVPYWSRASTPPTESEYETPSIWEDARGWPMRSLVSLARDGPPVDGFRPWRIDLGGTQGPLGLPRVLPIRPIIVGFAADTSLYAAMLWLLVCGPFAGRRLIRVKRGLCPVCAYPVGASAVCPECGNELPRRCRRAT